MESIRPLLQLASLLQQENLYTTQSRLAEYDHGHDSQSLKCCLHLLACHKFASIWHFSGVIEKPKIDQLVRFCDEAA